MLRSHPRLFLFIVLFLILTLGACSRGEQDGSDASSTATPTETATETAEVTSETETVQVGPNSAPIGENDILVTSVREELTYGDEVCGTGRTVTAGIQSYTVAEGQIYTTQVPSEGFETVGKSVFGTGSLYELSNRYCRLNYPTMMVFVRASDIGNALDN